MAVAVELMKDKTVMMVDPEVELELVEMELLIMVEEILLP